MARHEARTTWLRNAKSLTPTVSPRSTRGFDRPLRVVITDATAYWLEDAGHRRLTAERPTSAAAMSRVLAEFADGRDPASLVLVRRGVSFDRYETSRGTILVDLAGGSGNPRGCTLGRGILDRG
jgi:hypothetical protein